jgi:hypothetical protein
MKQSIKNLTPSPERSAILANHYWVADVDSGGAGHHPPAAAQENGE